VEKICRDGSLVDADARGPTGIDLVIADGEGRPVFVDLVGDDPRRIPTRVFEHRAWFEDNRGLFLRAYSRDGIVRAEEPVFAFVVGDLPPSVIDAVGAVNGVSVRLLRAECYSIDGELEILIDDLSPRPHASGRRQSDRGEATAGSRAGAAPVTPSAARPENGIESQAVRALLGLFVSGVDGLDGRVQTTEYEEGMTFRLGDRTLADVSVSQGSFTVSPGDSLVNPIVVSDRVSLERALNAVVSLFVREDVPPDAGEAPEPGLEDDERAALAEIWGAGIPADARSA
jgi:hypothetical protein